MTPEQPPAPNMPTFDELREQRAALVGMTADQFDAWAENLVADWPPFTPEQQSKLALILRPAIAEYRERQQQRKTA